MSEMVERVAKALFRRSGMKPEEGEPEMFEALARFVIGQMREPTPGMLEAGLQWPLTGGLAERWANMIDAALK